MKKMLICSLALCVLLTCFAAPALAAGKLSVVQEKFYVMPYSSYFAGYVYAEVKNTGDKPIDFNDGLLELYNADGDSIESSSYINCYPDILNPGDVGFIAVMQSVKEATRKEDIDDYLLTLTAKGAKDKTKVDFEVSNAHYQLEGNTWWQYHYLVANVRNTSDTTYYGFYVSFALKDDQGNLLYAEYCNPSYVGLLPGSQIQVRETVDSDIIKSLQESGITSFTVEAVAYAILDEK